MYKQIITSLNKSKDPVRAMNATWFFKTGPGEYGEGDKFIGIAVPAQRSVAKSFYKKTTLSDIQKLLNSPIHEHRLTGLFIMTYQYADYNKQDNPKAIKFKKELVDLYLKNTKNINNWDLVDSSAHKVLGAWLLDRDRKILYKLSKSKSLWERRIAMISTFAFTDSGQYSDSLAIARILLKDEHDLIHKAVGWVLREIGKQDRQIEELFLKKYYKQMPRTMLRYAIEKFPENLRQKYLKSKI